MGWSRRGFLRGAVLSAAALRWGGARADGPGSEPSAGLPPGRPADVTVGPGRQWRRVAAVGDRISAAGDRLGFDADYTCCMPVGEDRLLLWVNHEFPPGPLGDARLDRVVGGWTGKGATPEDLLAGMGGSVLELARDPAGGWRLDPDSRRAWRISGLGPETEVTGAGAAILGASVRGSISNCGGGVTPWGTVLTCEENHRYHVHEGLGSRAGRIGARPSAVASGGFSIPGLVSEHYGWVVEIDPRDPGWQPRRHTALARLRHESAAVRAVHGEPLRVYMPEDRVCGGIWRFSSDRPWRRGMRRDRASRLLESGLLEIARLLPDGTARWLPIHPGAAIDAVAAALVLRLGEKWGVDADFLSEIPRARTLADLYGSPAALLVDSFLAGILAGGTPLGRPEGAVWDGQRLSVALTTSTGLAPDDPAAPPAALSAGNIDNAAGSILQITDDVTGDIPGGAAGRAAWTLHTRAGDVFVNPDNLGLDPAGRLLVATDAETPGEEGHNMLCVYQNDRWERLLIAPPEAEVCGPSYAPDGALFCAIQHPAESWGESAVICVW